MPGLPADIEVFEPLSGAYRETHYRLPPRPPEAVKFVFGTTMVGAIVLALIPFGFSLFFAVVVPRDNQEFYWISILMPIAFFGLFLFPLAAAILLYGFTFRWGRIEIRCTAERLLVRSGWGLFRWTSRFPLAGLQGFRVQLGTLNGASLLPENQTPLFSALQNISALFADYENGRNKLICAGYTTDWLASLAEELTRRCESASGKREGLRPITIGDADPQAIVERTEQPSTSTARVTVQGDTLVIDHPARGFWRGVPGFFKLFGLFWNGFLVLWSFTFMPALFAGEVKWEDGPEKTSIWLGLLFSTPFYLVGIGFLVYFYAAATHAARWTIFPDKLELWERRLLGEQTQSWSREELASIRVNSKRSDDENKTWTTFLQISTVDGSVQELFGDRDKSELEWLATTLSKGLGLPLR